VIVFLNILSFKAVNVIVRFYEYIESIHLLVAFNLKDKCCTDHISVQIFAYDSSQSSQLNQRPTIELGFQLCELGSAHHRKQESHRRYLADILIITAALAATIELGFQLRELEFAHHHKQESHRRYRNHHEIEKKQSILFSGIQRQADSKIDFTLGIERSVSMVLWSVDWF
jgi:hypothetical protein